jgi:hypothetical protein
MTSEKRVFEGIARENDPYGWFIRKEDRNGIREDKDLGDLLQGMDYKDVRISIEVIHRCPICKSEMAELDVTNRASPPGKKEILRYCPKWREHPPGA